jgi:hypothetical protein
VDPLEVAIGALRLALVLVLYLFLITVVRLAMRSLNPPVAEPALLRLQVLEAGSSALEPGSVLALSEGATLGRAERASVVIADPTVSAEHARLQRQGVRWMVADLGSTNGTLVNQQRVQGQQPLAPGDTISLGNVRLRVVGR